MMAIKLGLDWSKIVHVPVPWVSTGRTGRHPSPTPGLMMSGLNRTSALSDHAVTHQRTTGNARAATLLDCRLLRLRLFLWPRAALARFAFSASTVHRPLH